jgi:VanZ family protein
VREPKASDRTSRLLLLGYLVFLVYASLYPIGSFRLPEESPFTLFLRMERIARADALTNLLVYLPLGFFLALRWPELGSFRAALIGCSLSLAIEYLQAFLPGRFPSLLDWGLNSAGTILGAEIAARLPHISRLDSVAILAPGPRTRLGLIAVGTWVAAQLFPFVPSGDVDYLREGLRPLWRVLRGQASFSFAEASVYALAALSLASILGECLRPNRRSRLLVPFLFIGVLLAKVPIITRQLSLEAILGVLFGLAIAWRLSQSRPEGRVPFVAALGAFVVEELRSDSNGSGPSLAFNWIPLRNHLANELVGAADMLAAAWPFLALAFMVSGWRGFTPRRAALGGGGVVFLFVMALEWIQRFLPGRSPDVTDALIALGTWLLAWLGISGSGRASSPRPAPEDRRRNPARSSPDSESR